MTTSSPVSIFIDKVLARFPEYQGLEIVSLPQGSTSLTIRINGTPYGDLVFKDRGEAFAGTQQECRVQRYVYGQVQHVPRVIHPVEHEARFGMQALAGASPDYATFAGLSDQQVFRLAWDVASNMRQCDEVFSPEAVATLGIKELPEYVTPERLNFYLANEKTRLHLKQKRLLEQVAAFAERYVDVVPPQNFFIPCHPDRRAGNILVHEGRLSAVLDWDGVVAMQPEYIFHVMAFARRDFFKAVTHFYHKLGGLKVGPDHAVALMKSKLVGRIYQWLNNPPWVSRAADVLAIYSNDLVQGFAAYPEPLAVRPLDVRIHRNDGPRSTDQAEPRG
jgi:hypothetical protein